MPPLFRALINYEDTYIQPLLLSALSSHLPPDSYTLITSSTSPLPPSSPRSPHPLLQILQYESLDFSHALAHPLDSLCNAYIIRKALIRKHFLSRTIREWTVKHPDSVLKGAWRECVELEVDYAEFLEEALDESESWELVESLRRNEGVGEGAGGVVEGGVCGGGGGVGVGVGVGAGEGVLGREDGAARVREREYWILKPGMSDRGQGIRLFSTMDELRAIFEAWEVDDESDAEQDEVEDAVEDGVPDGYEDRVPDGSEDANQPRDETSPDVQNTDNIEGITTHHLRHFLLQPYIHRPLLISDAPYSNRKFHVRTYVVAYGALKVFVYRPMLALFASEPYVAPGELALVGQNAAHDATVEGGEDEEVLRRMRNIHLTNTCVQKSVGNTSISSNGTSEASSEHVPENVFLFSNLPLPREKYRSIESQIDTITAELFRAAVAQPTNFQPLPQAFEVFGVDFLVEDIDRRSSETEQDVSVQLLEVNAFPDFAQTGEKLRDEVVKGLWDDVVKHIIGPHFGAAHKTSKESVTGSNDRLAKVLDLDLHLV